MAIDFGQSPSRQAVQRARQLGDFYDNDLARAFDPKTQAQDFARRMKVISRVAPGLAEDPQMVNQLAMLPLNNNQLARRAREAWNFVVTHQMAGELNSMKPEEARKVWEELSPRDRRMLQQADNFNLARITADVNRGVLEQFGRFVADVGYRTIRSPITAFEALIDTFEDIDHTVDTAYTMLADNRSSGWTPASVARDWERIWRNEDPEQQTRGWATNRARELLDGDEDLLDDAFELSRYASTDEGIWEAAAEAGPVGSSEFASRYSELIEKAANPNFGTAVEYLRRGRIKVGNDVAHYVLPFEENSKPYAVASAAFELVFDIAVDPFIAAARVGKAVRMSKALVVPDLEENGELVKAGVESFRSQILAKADDDAWAAADGRRITNPAQPGYWDELVTAIDNDYVREAAVVADHMRHEMYAELAHVRPRIGKVHKELIQFGNETRRRRAAAAVAKGLDPLHPDAQVWLSARDFHEYLASTAGQVALVAGRFGVPFGGMVELPRLSRLGAQLQARKVNAESVIDFLAQRPDRFMVNVGPGEVWAPGSIIRGAIGGDPIYRVTNDGYELLDSKGMVIESLRSAAIAPLRPLARGWQLLSKPLPRYTALRLDAPETAEDLERALSYGLAGDEKWFWVNEVLKAPSLAQKREAYFAAMKVMFQEMGLEFTPTGRALMDRFLAQANHGFSATGNDVRTTVFGRRVSGIWPDADSSAAVMLPDYRELKTAVGELNRLGLIHFLFGGLPASAFDKFMGVWRPAVLLRFGFPIRAGLEEGLSFVFREGADKLFQHGWYMPIGATIGALAGGEAGGVGGAVVGGLVGGTAGAAAGPYPIAKRPDQELLLPIRTVNRALTWTMGREALQPGHSLEKMGTWIEERALTSKAMTDWAEGVTAGVRSAARFMATRRESWMSGHRGGWEKQRLRAATGFYNTRKYLELQALDVRIEAAEEALRQGRVQGQVVAEKAQRRLIRTLKNERLRLKWAEELGLDDGYANAFSSTYGEIAASGILDKAMGQKLRGKTVAVAKPGSNRPQYLSLGPLISTYSNQEISEVGLGALLWRYGRIQHDRLAEPALAVEALFVGRKVRRELQDFLDEVAIASPYRKDQAATPDELVKVWREAWQKVDVEVRGALKAYIRTGDTEDLARAKRFAASLPTDVRSHMRVFLDNFDRLPANVRNTVMVDELEMAHKVGMPLDDGILDALRAGDADVLETTMRNAMRRRLTRPDVAEKARFMDRLYATQDGRTVAQPVAEGDVRLFTVVGDHPTASSVLARLTTGDVPPDMARAVSAATPEDVARFERSFDGTGLAPLTRWATTDDREAAEMMSIIADAGLNVRLAWVDVPVSAAKGGVVKLEDLDLYRLKPLDPDEIGIGDAMDDWVNVAFKELRDLTFSRQGGEPIASVVRPLADPHDGIDMPHLVDVMSDVPKAVMAPEQTLYHEGFFNKIVRVGWDKMVTPMIAAMIREPLFIEAYIVRRFQAQMIEAGLRDDALYERYRNLALRVGKPDLPPLTREQWDEIERNVPVRNRPLEKGVTGETEGGPDPDAVIVGQVQAGRRSLSIDEDQMRANYKDRLALERHPDSAFQRIYAELGVDVEELYQWFEAHGGYDAYRRFVIEHERGHQLFGHPYDPDHNAETTRIFDRYRDRLRQGMSEDEAFEGINREMDQWHFAREIAAENFAFASLGMPFGSYSGMLDADRALDEMRRQWRALPGHLKSPKATLREIRESDEAGPWIKKLNEKELGLIRDAETHLKVVDEHASRIALEGAFNDTIGYIDDHRLRSQFQEYVRNFMPFQFAEEQFVKRWAKTLKHSPESFRKAYLMVGFMRDVGVIEQDEFGDWQYIVPGSAALYGAWTRAIEAVTGKDLTMPWATPFSGSLKYSIPGLDFRGLPAVSPLVAINLKFLKDRFPELQAVRDAEEILVDERGRDRPYWEMIVPTVVRNTWQAIHADPDRDRAYAAAEHDAIRALMANPKTALPDDATPEQIDQFQTRVRNWARNLVLFKAIFGTFTPATPTPEIKGSIQPEFRKMLSAGIGYEEALTRLMAKYPDATPYTIFSTRSVGGAPLPATKKVFDFLSKNGEFVGAYKYAAGYLLPEPKFDTDYDARAYRQSLALGLRERKSTEEIIREIKFQEAADVYFKAQEEKDLVLAQIPSGDPRSRQVREAWRAWANDYLKAHPIFAEELVAGKGRQRRMQVLSEMRLALADPRLPRRGIPHLKHMAALVEGYDQFRSAMSLLAERRDRAATQARAGMRDEFDNWALGVSHGQPMVRNFYLRVIRPEIDGLDPLEEAA